MNDFLNMGDSFCPKGLVIIQDATGKILVKKHNMILREGKSVIMSKMIKAAFNDITFDDSDIDNKMVDDSNYNFDGIYLSSFASETEYDKTYNYYIEMEGTNNYEYYYPFSDFNIIGTNKKDSNSSNNMTIYYGNNTEFTDNIYKQYCMKFVLTIETKVEKQTSAINSLGILLKNASNGYKMFSRVVFDTIPLQAGAKYVVSYYVYF